ncbi:MAG: NADH-quinone oxidoreductase subunit M [Gammaproteobacteria bacterium]|nr:NADH-quinone oxidoreductase subunit M [Gammaproteobacteria bacterium]
MHETIQSLISDLPLLSLMIITLPVGAGLIWLIPSVSAARWIALIAAMIDLCISLLILFGFDQSKQGFQFVEHSSWIPSLHIDYIMGVDGISILFLPLTVLLFIGVILASWNSKRKMPRLYFSLLLLLESTTIGVYCSLDTILFFMFWELTLLPLYFLISTWGIGPHRRYAAVKYTLFMLLGGIPLLFAFILLAFHQAEISGLAIPAGLSFDYVTLIKSPVSAELQVTIFLLLLAGFAVKAPVIPLHTWLPVVSMEGPAAVTALLTGLKLGSYGLIRFAVPLAPQAAQDFHWLLAGFGIVAVLYGAIAALAQTNLRRMLAFSSISHVGLVILGIASFNIQGIQGALFQLISFTMVAGGIFIIIGMLQQRTGSTDIMNLGGIANTMPLLASFFFIFGLAGMGVPLTSGFPGELLIIISALKSHTGSGLAALLVMVLTAGYFLRIYRQAFLGPVNNAVIEQAIDLQKREILVAVVLTSVMFLLGIQPGLALDLMAESTQGWLLHLGLSVQ